jgi:peroxiredoxin (alkyl hydroperoxide reductase subunit C)
VHLAWQRHEGELANVKYLMASDVLGDQARAFGVLDEGSGLALRGSFLIGPDGKLTNSEVNFYNLGRNIDELMRKFKANLYLARKSNEVCPAKWKDEGDKTLVNPGAKMVGRVHEALNAPAAPVASPAKAVAKK